MCAGNFKFTTTTCKINYIKAGQTFSLTDYRRAARRGINLRGSLDRLEAQATTTTPTRRSKTSAEYIVLDETRRDEREPRCHTFSEVACLDSLDYSPISETWPLTCCWQTIKLRVHRKTLLLTASAFQLLMPFLFLLLIFQDLASPNFSQINIIIYWKVQKSKYNNWVSKKIVICVTYYSFPRRKTFIKRRFDKPQRNNFFQTRKRYKIYVYI